jgi:KaiC/GvpD/RAD55 family RecA-like ATPase
LTTAHQFAPRSSSRSDLIPSGILPLDQQLEGMISGRTYVLSGAPGTGKSVAALQFLVAGLNAGERAAILTQDDPEDLLSLGEFLGVDLASAIASERLYLLRYQLDFSRRFARLTTPEIAFVELRKLLGAEAPSRFAIDSVVPFIDAGGSSATSASAMLQLLDELGATSLVTYPGDLAGVYDRRLDPLVQRAAAIFHFSADRQRQRHIEIRKVRYRVPSVAPINYRIEPGVGIAPAAEEIRWHQDEAPAPVDRKRLVLDLPSGAADEALRLLQTHYSVTSVNGHRRLTPIKPLLAIPARRAADFPGSSSPPVLSIPQPIRNGARIPFDAAAFRSALLDVAAREAHAFFSLAVVTAPPGEMVRLTKTALDTVRALNGDLVGATRNQVLIYLHGTGRKHAPCFVERLRNNWEQAGSGELVVDIVAYPADQDRLRTVLNSTV